MPRSKPSSSRNVPWSHRAALVVAALLLFGVLGELATRSLGLLDRVNGFPRHVYRWSGEAELPYELRANLDTHIRNVPVFTDENGMRTAGPQRPPRTSSARRVLVFGDSVAFGYHLPFDQSLAAKLGPALRARTGHEHEVWNGGVPGYNTAYQAAWIRRHIDAINPHLAVLLFNLNDFDHGPVLGPGGVLTTDRNARASNWSPASVSEFYVLLRWLGRFLLGSVTSWLHPAPAAPPPPISSGGQSFDPFDRYVSALRKRSYAEPEDPRQTALVSALADLRDELVRREIPLVVAVIPDGDQVGFADADLTPQDRLHALCANLELACIDVLPAFEARAHTGPLFVDIMHPNAAGHSVATEAIADWIAENPQ